MPRVYQHEFGYNAVLRSTTTFILSNTGDAPVEIVSAVQLDESDQDSGRRACGDFPQAVPAHCVVPLV